jgi:hypothetical protein
MAFTVYGIHMGKPVQVTWRDGRLDGDPTLVKRLEGYVEAGEPIGVMLLAEHARHQLHPAPNLGTGG